MHFYFTSAQADTRSDTLHAPVCFLRSIIWRCRSYINHKKRTRRTVENNDVELTDVMDAREVY